MNPASDMIDVEEGEERVLRYHVGGRGRLGRVEAVVGGPGRAPVDWTADRFECDVDTVTGTHETTRQSRSAHLTQQVTHAPARASPADAPPRTEVGAGAARCLRSCLKRPVRVK